VAREWWDRRKEGWSDEYRGAVVTRFEQDIFPFIGAKPVNKLEAVDCLECLERMQKGGVVETAHTRCEVSAARSCVTRLQTMSSAERRAH
jgi:hypothetical protein